MMNNGAVEKLISLNGDSLAVGVTLSESSGMLDAWVAVVSQTTALNIDPSNVSLHILTPAEKQIAPIAEWKLNSLRIGNKVRLRKTVVPAGGTASGYVLFPNEKKRERILVEVPLGDTLFVFPFDFAKGSKDGK